MRPKRVILQFTIMDNLEADKALVVATLTLAGRPMTAKEMHEALPDLDLTRMKQAGLALVDEKICQLGTPNQLHISLTPTDGVKDR